MSRFRKFEEKYSFCWLILGIILTFLSYGIFNTGICAWIFAIPLIRYINVRTKWTSILLMLLGMVIVANITFWHLVEDKVNIMNQVFCTLNGIRIWIPFFVYFLCRRFKTKKLIAYFAFPAAVAVFEFFIDNPFISVMTSLSISQFWNIGLMQLASVTGVVGVSFVVALFASIVNYVLEEGIKKSTIIAFVSYILAVVVIISVGMSSIQVVTTADKTVRIATSVENINALVKKYSVEDIANKDKYEEFVKDNLYIIRKRSKDAIYNRAKILVFPEDAFMSLDSLADDFIKEVQKIAKEEKINIVLPLLRLSDVEGGKKKNTLNFIDSKGKLVNTYLKNHLVPVVEEPVTEKGDGKTPVFEIDGVKYTYLICADYTSNKYAYNGREADIFLNPSYDWQAFQYFTSYGVQARAIECGFSVLRNPVNGNIFLYDYNGRPLHMTNVMNVHEGLVLHDVPKEGRQTFYGLTGNWFPWICAIYIVFAIFSGFIFNRKRKNK